MVFDKKKSSLSSFVNNYFMNYDDETVQKHKSVQPKA